MTDYIERLKNVSAPILISGETGTGKSRLAGLIHAKSGLHRSPFITVHAASLSENLLESELFGHTKGAFTGAVFQRRGYCETVRDGILFFDEIGELSNDAQKKFLYLLEERKFVPVGTCNAKSFQGRIIAATNCDLWSMVEKGTFRKDLYYRLMVYSYKLPSLREDKAKLEELLFHFLEQSKKETGRSGLKFCEETLRYLLDYTWPGNVRELKNCIEYVSNLTVNDLVKIGDLPPWIIDTKIVNKNCPNPKVCLEISKLPLDYHQAVELFERAYLQHVMNYYGGKINHTARELKVSKSTLIAKIRKYGINVWQIRADIKKIEQESLKRLFA